MAVSGASAGALPVVVAGSIAAAIALTSSFVALAPIAPDTTTAEGTSSSQSLDAPGDATAAASRVNDNLGGDRTDPSNLTIPTVPSIDTTTVAGGASGGGLGAGLGGVVESVGGAVGGLVDAVIGTVTGGTPPAGHTASGGVIAADINLNLAGTATPGAHLSLQAGGVVYATTRVSSNGTFVINVTGIPGGLSSLDLVQTVDRDYLAAIVGSGGLLGGLLGVVDGLINDLIKPLNLSSGNNQGINVRLVS